MKVTLFHVDAETDMTNLTVAFRNCFAKETKMLVCTDGVRAGI